MDANYGSIAQNQAQRLFKEEMAFQQSNLIQIHSIKMIHQVSEAIALVSKHKLLQFIGDSHV